MPVGPPSLESTSLQVSIATFDVINWLLDVVTLGDLVNFIDGTLVVTVADAVLDALATAGSNDATGDDELSTESSSMLLLTRMSGEDVQGCCSL